MGRLHLITPVTLAQLFLNYIGLYQKRDGNSDVDNDLLVASMAFKNKANLRQKTLNPRRP